jgi:hypothetical protein
MCGGEKFKKKFFINNKIIIQICLVVIQDKAITCRHSLMYVTENELIK